MRFVTEEELIMDCENSDETSALRQCVRTKLIIGNSLTKGLEAQTGKNEIFEKLSRVCRCCLIEHNDLQSLFDEQNSIISKMTLLTSMQIAPKPNDCLPCNICEGCLQLLTNAIKFRQQILNADMSLKYYITVGYTKGRELQILELEQFTKAVSDNAAMKIGKVDRNNHIVNMLSEEGNDKSMDHFCVQKTKNSELVITSSNREEELKRKSNEHDDNVEHQKIVKIEAIEQMNINNDTILVEEIHQEDEREKQIVAKEHIISLEENNIQRINYSMEIKTENSESIIVNSNIEQEIKEKSDNRDNNVEQQDSIKIEIVEEVDDNEETSNRLHLEEEMETKNHKAVDENTHEKRKRGSTRNIDDRFSLKSKTNISKSVTNDIRPSTSSNIYVNLKRKSSLGCNLRYRRKNTLYSKKSKANNESSEEVHLKEEKEKEIVVEEDKNERATITSTRTIRSNSILINEENNSLELIIDKSNICSFCNDVKCQSSSGSYLECTQKKMLNKEEFFKSESDLYMQDSIFEINSKFGSDEQQFACTKCEKTFTEISEFNSHLKKNDTCDQYGQRFIKHHSLVCENQNEEKPYVCNICDKKFDCTKSLRYHLKNHSGEKKYACDQCSKRFNRPSNLVRHIRIHSGDKPYVCNACNKKFATSSDLKTHFTIHSGDKKCACNRCSKRFTRHHSLVEHIRRHNGEKPFICNICNKKFTTRSNLKLHLTVHSMDKTYVCKQCNKRFARHSTLVQHIRRHTGEKPHVCNTCDKKFAILSELKRHLDIHSGEKKYPCSECSKRFKRYDVLVNHLRRHTGEKPHVCNTCDKKFTISSELKRHLEIHSGEKKYPCSQCSKRFNRPSNLIRHIRIHSGDKPYVCNTCGKKFATSSNLKLHLRMH